MRPLPARQDCCSASGLCAACPDCCRRLRSRSDSPSGSILRVILVTVGIAAATIFVFGLGPALSSARSGIAHAASPRTAGGRLRRWSARNVLVVAQIAVSFVLIVTGLLFVRGLRSAQRIDPGFDVRPMLLATIAPVAIGYDDARARIFFRDLVDRLGATPGIRQVSAARRIPLDPDGGGAAREIDPPDHVPLPGDAPLTVHYNSVWPNYFSMMGTRLLRGRAFAERDNADAGRVVIVNETMARKYWPDGTAVGRTIRVKGPMAADFEIIGIVQDGKYNRLNERPDPYLFFSLLQAPSSELTLMVEPNADADAGAAAANIRDVLKQLDPRMPTLRMMTLEEHTRFAYYEPHVTAVVVGNLGGVGLLLSLVGLYGVVAFIVARRTREIGVRMALGARPADIFRAVLTRQWTRAVRGARRSRNRPAGDAGPCRIDLTALPSDPFSYASTGALLMIVSAIASCWPAYRAMRVNPARALRTE